MVQGFNFPNFCSTRTPDIKISVFVVYLAYHTSKQHLALIHPTRMHEIKTVAVLD